MTMTIDPMLRPLAAAWLLSLAACDSGGVVDQTIRTGVRQSAVETCVAWVPRSDIALAAGLDSQSLCGCAADRMLEAKGAADLASLNPASAEFRAAVAQCVRDVRASGKAAGG